MAQSVEAITADAPFPCPRLRQWIGSGSLRQRCMKSSVECCYLWNLWQDLLDCIDALQARRVVERGQLCQFVDRLLHLRCDKHRGGVALAAMNNAMSYGSEVFRTLQ